MSFTSLMLRRAFKKSDDARDAGLVTPEDVVRYDDIVYGTNKRFQRLDVYRPKDVEGKLPVIVSVHGGGWVYGDKERYQYYCMDLARRGFAVVNFTYRLAPEHKFPSQLEDTNKVFNWIKDNSEQYGFDMNNLFALGDSAGAHILSLYCCLCINEQYASNYPFKASKELLPKAVCLNCGVYKIEISEEKDLTSSLMKDVLPRSGAFSNIKLLSPIEYVTSDFPVSFIMSANEDFLKDEAPLMKEKLKSLGVKTLLKIYGDENTKLGHVFHCDIKTDAAKLCNDEQCYFFKSFVS